MSRSHRRGYNYRMKNPAMIARASTEPMRWLLTEQQIMRLATSALDSTAHVAPLREAGVALDDPERWYRS
ncbi:MAG: hypothetical protein ACRDST_17810 [Pseudonocardiaceae bacterium]